MQKNITAQATGRAYRVFLTPTAPKYTAAMYNTVSEDPMMTEAVCPINESAPTRSKRSAAIAFAAEPESGRRIRSGSNADGRPIFRQKGERKSVSHSKAPEARKKETVQRRRISVGMSRRALSSPSRAPAIKSS